jgi:hypothetical protein
VTWLLNWRLWAAGLLLAGLSWSHLAAYHAGRDRVQIAWDREHAETARQALIATRKLQDDQDARTKRLQAALAAATAGRDASLRRLRDISAADILPSVATPECAGQRSSDADILRARLADLLSVAADADRDRAALTECREAYDAARNR